MQTNRALGVVLLLLVGAAAVFFWSGFGGGDPIAPVSPSEGQTPPAAVAPADATVDASAEKANAPPAADAAAAQKDERTAAVTAGAAADREPRAICGQVVGPDGQPVSGAKVMAAGSMAFVGGMTMPDFDALEGTEFANLTPQGMAAAAKRELQERVQATTGADGRFRLVPLGASMHVSLRVLARGHAILDRNVPRPIAADVDVGALRLVRGAVVAGRVVDAQERPIEGARVRRFHEIEARWMAGLEMEMPEQTELEDLRGEAAVTDATGAFELPHLPAGELALAARHPDHPTARRTGLEVVAGAELRDVVLTMRRGREIRGRVVGVPEGETSLRVLAAAKPNADANPMGSMFGFLGGDASELFEASGLSVGERSEPVAADGTFVLRGLGGDVYRVWVTRAGAGIAGGAACSERLEVNAGTVGIELRYEAGVAVTFAVVDAATGAPVERLRVRDTLRGGGGFADLVDQMPRPAAAAVYPGGRVVVAGLRPKPKQTLRLTVGAVGYRTHEREGVQLPKAGALDLGTIRLDPVPVVEVTVVEDETGRPVPDARVQLLPKESRSGDSFRRMVWAQAGAQVSSERTDAEGRARLNALGDGVSILEVESPMFAPFVSEELQVGVREVTARLHVGGRVDVTVLDAEGKAAEAAAVEHRAPSGDVHHRKTAGNGVARFERLTPGKHEFRLGADGGPMAALLAEARADAEDPADADAVPWQSVDVVDRAELRVQLEKKPSAALRGVVRENGRPLAGARVSFREGGTSDENDMAENLFGNVMESVGQGGSKRSSRTGEDGVYALSELPSGEHRLQITHRGRAMPCVVPVQLQNGANTLDVELDMTTLVGVVRDAQGNPVAGAKVSARRARSEHDLGFAEDMMDGVMPGMSLGGGSTLKTDEAGNFELRGVDPDVPLAVHATAKGFAPATVEATVAKGARSAMLEVKLGAAGRIKVTATVDAPFAMVLARFEGDESVRPVMQMLQKGKATLDGLRPGKWKVSIQGRGDGDDEATPRERTVDVVAGETVTVEL